MKYFQRWKHTALHNKALVLTGVLVAAGTLFYAGAAIFQICLMKYTAKEATVQTERLIAESNRIAKSMETANAQNKKSMEDTLAQSKATLDANIRAAELDQRAWVGLKTLSMVTLEAGKPVNTACVFTNTGKTVALDATYNVTFKPNMGPLDIGAFASSKDRPAPKRVTPAVMFPNFEFTLNLSSSEIVDAETIRLIKSKVIYIFVFGEVHYRDIFKKAHVTKFCGQYNPEINKFDLCGQYQYAN